MGKSNKITVLLAEDHHVVRTAVAALLAKEPDIEVIGEVPDGSNLVETVDRLKPDILLMDAQMPHHKPVKAAETLRNQQPDTRIVALSAYDLPEYVVGLLKVGTAGYVLKDDPSELLVHAVRLVAQGQEYVSPRVARILVESVRQDDKNLVANLTERETEVLQLMAYGRRNNDIAKELVISEQTVKNHVTSIFRKLGTETRVEAVLYAISVGLVTTQSIKDELNF